MIRKYNNVFIIYGGTGKEYASLLNDKIVEVSKKDRYPLKSSMVMESILTSELLSDIILSFKNSEFCVAFLTKDDHFVVDGNKKRRLRQNIVFELGMAIMQLGRENCILLSDFDIHNNDFELPSDMNSLEIKCFESKNIDETLDDVIDKILQLSQRFQSNGDSEEIPRYDRLLSRKDYYIDYENIFSNRPSKLAIEGKGFIKDTVSFWLEECSSLPHYDERCIYLFERIGFLPIFGHNNDTKKFIIESEKLIDNYSRQDIIYYGETDILNFTKNLISCVVEYTSLKTNEKTSDVNLYKKLLDLYMSEEIPDRTGINPLILLIYYDYLGLIYFRLYKNTMETKYLQSAHEAFEKALPFVSKVDMSLNIWSGFLHYNLARVNMEKQNLENATKFFEKAIRIREKWLKNAKYNVTVRNALSYEYFIAKIDYIDMRKKYKIVSDEQIKCEYEYVSAELNTYSNMDEKIDQLIYIRDLINERTNNK